MTPLIPARPLVLTLLALGLAGCSGRGDLVIDEGVGVVALRTSCPTVAVPHYTGDVTLFNPAGSTDAAAIDVVASITNVRSQCTEGPERIATTASFDVHARRTDTRGPRQVQLPYFVSVVRGGSSVVSKRVGTVTLTFADGQARAQASAQAGASVDRAEATLPPDIRAKLTRRRRAGEEAAAVDPLSEPDVRTALARASFELLVGFQLSDQQLAYNATR